jgi:hypothetical protein
LCTSQKNEKPVIFNNTPWVSTKNLKDFWQIFDLPFFTAQGAAKKPKIY